MNITEFITLYKEITKDCSFNTDPTDTFYYCEQDHLNTNLLVKNCIEIDIVSAFPNLCKFILGESHPFVQKIFSFENKLERNKFIAISFSHNQNLKNFIGDNGLKLLNSYCKLFILGYMYNNFTNISIIEYKKDGAIFSGNLQSNPNEEFNQFIESVGLQFHVDKVPLYMRFNKTSVFQYENKLEVKGKYKNPPKYLQEEIIPNVLNIETLLNIELLTNIKLIYSNFYYTILSKAELNQEINNYYKFSNKFINEAGELDFIPANPKNILIYFLYPMITMLKLDK